MQEDSTRRHPPMRPAITVRSYTRRIDLNTRLADESAWLLLLIPDGWTDQQVLAAAENTLPADAVVELREVIKRQAEAETS
jgi:hypothetical protein